MSPNCDIARMVGDLLTSWHGIDAAPHRRPLLNFRRRNKRHWRALKLNTSDAVSLKTRCSGEGARRCKWRRCFRSKSLVDRKKTRASLHGTSRKTSIFADRAVARLHGLNPEETVRGLPIEVYLARVHPDDRPRLAKGITETIVAELPQKDGYRVQGVDGINRAVVAFGRAFRNRDGDAVLYSGVIVPDPMTTSDRPN